MGWSSQLGLVHSTPDSRQPALGDNPFADNSNSFIENLLSRDVVNRIVS